MISGPERNSIELGPQRDPTHLCEKRFFALELLGGPRGEAVLALKLEVGPDHFALGIGLTRHEQPLVCFGDAKVDCLVGALAFGFGLAGLELVQVKRYPVLPDR